MTDYYDIIMGLIPASLAGLTALLVVAGMSLSVSVPLASTVTLGLIGHAMFINGPSVPRTGSGTGSEIPADSTKPKRNATANRLSAE